MPDRQFRDPNLQAQRGSAGKAFLSLHASGHTVGISSRAARILGIADGDRLHVSLDRTGTAWVGVVSEPTGQQEPAIHVRTTDDEARDARVNSTLAVTQLRNAYDLEDGEGHRLRFTGAIDEHPEHGITLYELSD